jgi:hypothetical protein
MIKLETACVEDNGANIHIGKRDLHDHHSQTWPLVHMDKDNLEKRNYILITSPEQVSLS